MVSRLRKKNKRIITSSVTYMPLDSFILNSGDIINFECRIVSKKTWFSINQQSNYHTSSFYDGPDFKKACEMYVEILLAFKGINKAEEFSKSINILERKIEKLKDEYKIMTMEDMYPGLKKKPLFLGNNEF